MNASALRNLSIYAGYYSGFPYAMAVFIVEVPYIIVQSILFSLLVRHMLPISFVAPHVHMECTNDIPIWSSQSYEPLTPHLC